LERIAAIEDIDFAIAATFSSIPPTLPGLEIPSTYFCIAPGCDFTRDPLFPGSNPPPIAIGADPVPTAAFAVFVDITLSTNCSKLILFFLFENPSFNCALESFCPPTVFSVRSSFR